MAHSSTDLLPGRTVARSSAARALRSSDHTTPNTNPMTPPLPPPRSPCHANTTGKLFSITDHDQPLAAARQQWRDGDDPDDYRQHRPMVERSIAWLVANGHRRVRYRGIDRNRHALTIRAATINLRRLLNLGLNWNNGWTLTT